MVGILHYNENKVRTGHAELLAENLFGAEPAHLSFYDKLRCFENYMARNRRATTNAVHISLNFHPSEAIERNTLIEISSTYMERLGFGNQPYLVYEHHDAAHQHLHIVTTNITWTGDRISLHNIGKLKSEPARKHIEKEFGLAKAAIAKERKRDSLAPVIYGTSESHHGLASVVAHVTQSYKFTSLPELNAVLHQFNVVADRGNDSSQMFQRRGLLYRIVGPDKKTVGVPFKASSLSGRPTLNKLEKQFKVNEILRNVHRRGLSEKVTYSLKSDQVRSINQLANHLKKQDVDLVMRSNDEGRIYGLTFIDHKTKVVFNGSDLGKAFSATAVQDLLKNKPAHSPDQSNVIITRLLGSDHATPNETATTLQDAIAQLIEAQPLDVTSPEYTLKLRRRKRKKRRSI